VILVDPAVWPWRGRRWAHLASDEAYEELHDFAARLGLRRLAFQGDHYDVDQANRFRAVRAGAREVDARQLVRQLRAAGLRRRVARSGLRWHVVGEWPLGAWPTDGRLLGAQPPGETTPPMAAPPGPLRPAGTDPVAERSVEMAEAAEPLPPGALAELVRAGRALPDGEVVLRAMVRNGEFAAVLARPGCDLPLPLPELVVEGPGPWLLTQI
jgi:hypothetical protein